MRSPSLLPSPPSLLPSPLSFPPSPLPLPPHRYSGCCPRERPRCLPETEPSLSLAFNRLTLFQHPSGRCSAEGSHGRCLHRSRAGVRSIFRKQLQLGMGAGIQAVTSPLLSPCPQSCGLSINHHLHKFALNDQNESWCFPGYKVGVTLPFQQPPESPSCPATDSVQPLPPTLHPQNLP